MFRDKLFRCNNNKHPFPSTNIAPIMRLSIHVFPRTNSMVSCENYNS
jgi:hypothetical protein